MPNHVHGIPPLSREDAGTADRAPTVPRRFGPLTPSSLATTIGAYKSGVTRRVHVLRGTPGKPVWQENYYERIIRDQRELEAIRRYIDENPLKWSIDRENPAASEPECAVPWKP